MAELKNCKRCGKDKPHSEFNHQGNAKDNRATRCRVCTAEVNAARHQRIKASKPEPWFIFD